MMLEEERLEWGNLVRRALKTCDLKLSEEARKIGVHFGFMGHGYCHTEDEIIQNKKAVSKLMLSRGIVMRDE